MKGVIHTALKYSDYADGVAYVATAVGTYEGFVSAHPSAAVLILTLAAGAYALANYLKSKGD